ncbi:DUF4129 domain-containing protein [Nocardiopsis ansamitocini]|uniref:Membrane protein n=1 Tax=Nocardiopsis ansamitocini TaxID=1670832 RepID=A0A9W6P9W4_9ACTN|nr:DUF4129 domain-containing protein [Nocardiopsis ansamitocini]GLU49663.1 membrane protein [Nocardiopsis ansamitocini]
MSDPVGRGEAARAAQEELAKSIYREQEPSLIDRLYSWAMGWLDSLLNQVAGSVAGGWWVVGPLLLLLAVLLVVLVVYLRPARRAKRAAVVDGGTVLTASGHRDRAERHAVAQEYADAIRERLRAITRDLEERALITPRPGRTATELAAETSGPLPELRADLDRAAVVFNDVWYGERAATAEGYQALVAVDDAVRAARPVKDAEPTR